MAPIIITVQNISGNILNKKVGWKICPLKINDVHKSKPSILILTETRHINNFDGKGIFKGYSLAQGSSSGSRSAGVLVFTKKG